MVRRYLAKCKPWQTDVLALFMLLYTLFLTGVAAPGDLGYKPIRKDPPWPPVCQMDPGGPPCGPLY